MNSANFQIASGLVSYVKQAEQARHQREKLVKDFLDHRKIPDEGWDDITIQSLLSEIAMMDSNNFIQNVGAGEREGRVYSKLVSDRHYHLAHGIGKSGDIVEIQPKAAGSSLMYLLTNEMALDLLHLSGLKRAAASVVLPVATGMALSLCMLSLQTPQKRNVLWCRIDQKSCFKSIITAGLMPVVIENVLEGDQLVTNLEELEKQILSLGSDTIACVLSTTSCFAPRGYDRVEEIAALCQKHQIKHVINNAYGLQDSKCAHVVNEAMRLGEVSFIVQSTDKNIMVPVGGAIVCSPHKKNIEALSKMYPGIDRLK